MTQASDSMDLTGKLLIAAPGMSDTRFEGSVIFVCAHSPEGAMGLIVNMPTPEIEMNNLLEQLDIARSTGSRDIRVHFGGPVETGRGFVLHSGDYATDDATLEVSRDFHMTASLEILKRFAEGNGPSKAMLMLGYAGWGPGQLEDEIIHDGWLVADADAHIVFDDAPAQKWVSAVKSLGIDPIHLSGVGGTA